MIFAMACALTSTAAWGQNPTETQTHAAGHAESGGRTYSYSTSSQTEVRYNGHNLHSLHRRLLIDWRPEVKDMQRYTVSISPLRLLSGGLKVDFEKELARPGQWIATGLTIYFLPEMYDRNDYLTKGDNNRWGYYSGFEDFQRMWGLGSSVFYKNIFSRRGWYFATGVKIEYFNVGLMVNSYVPYTEEGQTYYDYTRALSCKDYVKPSAEIYIGKHMAVSRRCYFDLYAGLGGTYSIYRNDGRHLNTAYSYNSLNQPATYTYQRFGDINGFAYRGIYPVAGFRFGVLLWDKQHED